MNSNRRKARVNLNSVSARIILLGIALALILLLATFVVYRTVGQNPDGFAQRSNIISLWETGDYARVLTYSESVLERNPIDARALFFAGAASYYLLSFGSVPEDQGRYLNQAILNLRTYLELKKNPPYAAEAHYLLGKAYYNKGSAYVNLVIQHLQQAINLGYQNTDIAEYIGMAHILLGDYVTGIEYLEKAPHRKDNYALEFNMAKAYTLAENYEEAQKLYQNVYQNSPNDNLRDQAYLQMAKIYYQMGRYPEAKDIFIDFLKKYPNNTEAHFGLGEIYYLEKNTRAAKRQWEAVVRLDPLNVEALTRLYGN